MVEERTIKQNADEFVTALVNTIGSGTVQEVVDKNLSVRETERMVKFLLKDKATKKKPVKKRETYYDEVPKKTEKQTEPEPEPTQPVVDPTDESDEKEIESEQNKLVDEIQPIEIEFVLPDSEPAPVSAETHQPVSEAEEIVIQLEDTPDSKQGTLFNLPGWMRGRR